MTFLVGPFPGVWTIAYDVVRSVLRWSWARALEPWIWLPFIAWLAYCETFIGSYLSRRGGCRRKVLRQRPAISQPRGLTRGFSLKTSDDIWGFRDCRARSDAVGHESWIVRRPVNETSRIGWIEQETSPADVSPVGRYNPDPRDSPIGYPRYIMNQVYVHFSRMPEASTGGSSSVGMCSSGSRIRLATVKRNENKL